jgi:NADPH-dependent curcumin reductase CurA
MEGFIVLDYLARMGEGIQALLGWVSAGEIKFQEDVQEGFENIPKTFLRLFRGLNQGKQLLKVADPPVAS